METERPNSQQNAEEREAGSPLQQGDNREQRVRDNFEKMKKKFLPGLKYSLLISLVINLAMLVVGALNVHKCPANSQIPLFLIATGAIALFSAFITYMRDRIIPYMETKYVETVLYTAQLVFLGFGMYWVFTTYEPSYDPDDGILYCNKTVFIFAFVYIIFVLVMALAMAIAFCCFLICVCYLCNKCIGTYWVYQAYKPSYDPKDGDLYCNKTAYLFAFVYITFILVIAVIIPICFCCFLVCICFVVGTMATNEIASPSNDDDAEDGRLARSETVPITEEGNREREAKRENQ